MVQIENIKMKVLRNFPNIITKTLHDKIDIHVHVIPPELSTGYLEKALKLDTVLIELGVRVKHENVGVCQILIIDRQIKYIKYVISDALKYIVNNDINFMYIFEDLKSDYFTNDSLIKFITELQSVKCEEYEFFENCKINFLMVGEYYSDQDLIKVGITDKNVLVYLSLKERKLILDNSLDYLIASGIITKPNPPKIFNLNVNKPDKK